MYYGNEFCSHLMPVPGELEEILNFAEGKNTGFSLVTGYAAEGDLQKYEALFKILEKRRPDSEVVINDWGILELCRDFPMQRLLGRLLSKQKKCMRILDIVGKLPPRAARHFQEISLNENFIGFLMRNGIKRVEMDNSLQGYRITAAGDLSFSLYMPYAYLTTTRLCPSNICNQEKGAGLRIPLSCKRTCRSAECLRLYSAQMPVDLLLKGNTVFYESGKVNLLYPNRQLDRIVFQPVIPL